MLVFKTLMKRWKGIFYIEFSQFDDDVDAENVMEVQCSDDDSYCIWIRTCI